MASLGLSLPLSPPLCLLPPAGMDRLFSGVSQSLCFGSVFSRLIFSLALPQFKRTPSDCSQGLWAGPYPKECRRLLSVPPPLLVAAAGVWGTFLLGVAFRHVSVGFVCLFVCLFSSQLCCPPRFKNFPQTRQCEGFLVIGNFLY